MAIDKEIKNRILEDWLNAFPELTAYTKDKLYKIVGPIVVGLELIKLPRTEEYRPHFVMNPLWKEDVASSLYVPIALYEYYNKKGLQYSIPYEKHDLYFEDVLKSINTQTLLSLFGDTKLDKIFHEIEEYSRNSPLSAAPNSYWQASLQEAKLKIALYIDADKAQSILEQIQKRNWDIKHFTACGVNIQEWLKGLQNTISNRDTFLKRIAINKQDKKIAKLKSSELLP